MPYIERKDGVITGIFTCEQYEQQEYLNDDSIEILNFGQPSEQDKMNEQAREYLKLTDWKVIRHRDQISQGIPTNLSEEEYISLLQSRQEARNKVI